jgi:hypothetical protein
MYGKAVRVAQLIFTAEILKQALVTLGESGEHWTQHAHARLADNTEVPLSLVCFENVEYYSIVGAITKSCYPNEVALNKSLRFVERSIEEKMRPRNGMEVMAFNNTCADFRQLRAVVERAIELATQ